MNNSEKLDLLLEKFNIVENRLDGIDGRLDGIDTRLDVMETDVKDIKLTIENEIRVNIQRIAEGHLDLSRNLQKALKSNQEVEMLAIKVRMLDTDVKEIQKRIS